MARINQDPPKSFHDTLPKRITSSDKTNTCTSIHEENIRWNLTFTTWVMAN